ncbi:unnamed protein product, partial [Symbiodinium necroappetens]
MSGTVDTPSSDGVIADTPDIWYDPVREDPVQSFSWDAGAEAEAQADELASEPDDQPAPKRIFEDARWAERAHEAKFQKVCKDLPRMPWEQGGWELIFEPSKNPLVQSLASRLQVSYGSEEACHLPPTNLPFASDLPQIPSAGVKARDPDKASRILGSLWQMGHPPQDSIAWRPFDSCMVWLRSSALTLSLLEQFVTMAKDIKVEADAESGVVLVLAGALGSKTATTAEARTRILPYVALGKGISNISWAEAWLEATNYLREALISMGCHPDEVMGYGSHSMKSTVLTWCGRSSLIQFSEPEQRALGHHLDPSSKSPLTYSREYYLKLYAKVLAVFDSIRQGHFCPDLPGAASVAAMAQALGEGRAVPQVNEGPLAKEGPSRAEDELESDDSDRASVELEAELEPSA